MSNLPAIQRRIGDALEEYQKKHDNIEQAIAVFAASETAIQSAAVIGGTYGDLQLRCSVPHKREIEQSLLKSAWRHVYGFMQIERIASAKDKDLFKRALENPAPFTLDNIRATFGDYLLNPRENILRGLAETFSDLDPAYKSHEKVKIGVKGLPKRIIMPNVGGYGWGRDRLANVINALAQVQGKPLVTHSEIEALLKDENALLNAWEAMDYKQEVKKYPARGIRLRRFSNGNGHLFFEAAELLDINRALAEYYGTVLPDAAEEATEKRQSTAVAKDLQYYPTPQAVIDRILEGDVYIRPGEKVLEPSCGCGRFLDALRAKGAEVFGIEVDPSRAAQSRAKGHAVLTANFLETTPKPEYDHVVMNPPFYGKHYAKHVEHARKFLKPDGKLTAILPATARYDHGLLNGRWSDLPTGSFRESGTNIATTVLTLFA